MTATREKPRRGANPVAAPDISSYFAGQAAPRPRYHGQADSRFQASLQEYHRAVQPQDCVFYHTVELPDGAVFEGEWDLRGHEDAYLGGQDFRGKRVIEYGPGSGWLSAYVAGQGGALTVLDVPMGSCPEIMPFADLDREPIKRNLTETTNRMRNSWWFVKRSMGFDATAIYADIYDPPEDLGTHDVAIFGCILLHLSNPFLALQRAAETTVQTIIVTDVCGPQEGFIDMLSGEDHQPALLTFGPSRLPGGVVHWWAMSTVCTRLMLARLGFTKASTTLHVPANGAPLFTVVAHRP